MKYHPSPFRLCLGAIALSQLLLFNSAQAGFFGIGSKKGEGYVPESVDGCRRISEAAKLTGTKALVIGYEGLGSSSWINANSLVSYRDKLAHGQKAHRPLFLFGGSFLTRGPLVKIVEAYKNKVEVLVFWRTNNQASSSVPAKCAKIWMSAGDPDRKVVIVGHSFGGGAAWLLADSLHKLNVPVAGVVTADPRPARCGGECWPSSWTKPANVADWENCYQLSPLRGQVVPGANNHFMGYIGHVVVQNTSCVYNGISHIISGVKGPLTTEALKYVKEGDSGGQGGSMPNVSGITGSSKDSSTISAGAGATRKISAPNMPDASQIPAYGRDGAVTTLAQAQREMAAGANSSASSALGQAVAPTDNVVHYVRPGSADLRPKSARSLSGTGASRPVALRGQAGATGAGGGSTGGESADTSGRAQAATADATAAANSLWFPNGPNGAAGSGPAAAGAGAVPSLTSLFNDNGAKLPEAPSAADSALGGGGSEEAMSPGSGAAASSPEEPSPEVSLFQRVHEKLTKLRPKS